MYFLRNIPNFLKMGISRRKCCAINFRPRTDIFSPMKWKCGGENRPQKNIYYALAIVLYTPLTALMKLSQPYNFSVFPCFLFLDFFFFCPQKNSLVRAYVCVCFIISIIKLLIHSERVAELCTATLWPLFFFLPPFFLIFYFEKKTKQGNSGMTSRHILLIPSDIYYIMARFLWFKILIEWPSRNCWK